jgi:hypothetical protein
MRFRLRSVDVSRSPALSNALVVISLRRPIASSKQASKTT